MSIQKCICVIPARYGSTRLKAKPLVDIGGKPMIRHVWERAHEAGVFSEVIVATDDMRIRDTVTRFGGHAVMTSRRLQSGTDRIAVIARRNPAPLIMNLQGDEPLMPPAGLADLVRAMRRDPATPMGTLARLAPWTEIADNPNAVKIAVDAQGRAIYFSRSPIPFDAGRLPSSGSARRRSPALLHHLGVYCYRRSFLLKFARWPRTPLENRERLEQLRVLEYGIRPRVVIADAPGLSIDTNQDVKRACEWLRNRGARRGTG